MAHDRIPIQLTHEEARAHLESAHAIGYRESLLGSTVYAFCRCRWKSPSVNAGFIAQAAASRHRVAFVDHPLENRARYAIYRSENAHGILRWILHDRESGRETGCLDLGEAVAVLNASIRREAAGR